MWQLRVHRLLLSWIYSNHKYSHLYFSLSILCSNWSDHQALDINLDLDNPKCIWRQTPLDFIRDSHTQHKQPPKNVARVFLLYLRQNIKPYTSYGVGLSWKFCKKSILHELQSIKSNFLSIKSCRKWAIIFCNYSIPTLQ